MACHHQIVDACWTCGSFAKMVFSFSADSLPPLMAFRPSFRRPSPHVLHWCREPSFCICSSCNATFGAIWTCSYLCREVFQHLVTKPIGAFPVSVTFSLTWVQFIPFHLTLVHRFRPLNHTHSTQTPSPRHKDNPRHCLCIPRECESKASSTCSSRGGTNSAAAWFSFRG